MDSDLLRSPLNRAPRLLNSPFSLREKEKCDTRNLAAASVSDLFKLVSK